MIRKLFFGCLIVFLTASCDFGDLFNRDIDHVVAYDIHGNSFEPTIAELEKYIKKLKREN